ncbi:MAG: hypothetical protein AAGL11_02985 [Pseudomonadota bacterium]
MLLRMVSLFGLMALAAEQSAFAAPDQLAPSGWTPKQKGEMIEYTAPSGRERIVIQEITSETDALAAARAIAKVSDIPQQNCKRIAGNELARCDGELAITGGTILIRAYAVEAESKVTGLIHMGVSTETGLVGRMDASEARLTALVSPAATTKAPVAPLPEPTSSAAMEKVVFDLSYSYGVGGAVYPKYAPLYLFKGGAACRCSDLAPGDVDVHALRRSRPEDVGTWRKSGGKYLVTYADGESDELDPAIGPPATIPNGRLFGRFGSIGGGGNTALGGNSIVIASKDYDFRADGTFSQESFGGGGNGVVTAGSKRGSVGQWRLDGATLTLSYPDGTRLRTSVYWSARGDLVNGVPDAIWIGGKAYKMED